MPLGAGNRDPRRQVRKGRLARPQRLEPERMGKTAQQFVAAVMVDNRPADNRPEAGHAIGKPPGDLSTVQRQVGNSCSLGRQSTSP